MFKDFVKAIQKNLQQMSKDSSRLFTVNVDQKLLELIERKQNEELAGKSIEELQAMLKA